LDYLDQSVSIWYFSDYLDQKEDVGTTSPITRIYNIMIQRRQIRQTCCAPKGGNADRLKGGKSDKLVRLLGLLR
jgi:hypothetical protein